MGTEVVFYLLFSVAVLSAIAAVTLRNVMHSALSLAGTLISVAGVFAMLQANFLAAVQVMLYAGGIMVLIVFAIMMIQRMTGDQHPQTNDQWLVAFGVCAVLLLAMASTLNGTSFPLPGEPSADPLTNVQRLGELLLKKYMVPFEVASVVLLAAMIGVIAIAKKD